MSVVPHQSNHNCYIRTYQLASVHLRYQTPSCTYCLEHAAPYHNGRNSRSNAESLSIILHGKSFRLEHPHNDPIIVYHVVVYTWRLQGSTRLSTQAKTRSNLCVCDLVETARALDLLLWVGAIGVLKHGESPVVSSPSTLRHCNHGDTCQHK